MELPLTSAATFELGSDGSADLVLGDEAILPQHARFHWDGASLRVEAHTGAPVAVNGEVPSGPVTLRDGDWLVLGATPFEVSLTLPGDGTATGSRPQPAPVAAPAPARASVGGGPEISVGRLPGSDIRIDSPVISRSHARVFLRDGQAVLEDLGSTNGTYLDGARLEGPAPIQAGARVDFGSFAFTWDGSTLHELESAGKIRLEARDLTKTVQDAATKQPKALLSHVNFVIEPGEFVGIFGTSGSGKSTLLDALNGRRPATDGAVLYNGADFYRCFDQFRASIGYVPQQDIVHRKITIRRALRYAARLRLPGDTTVGEIDGYIDRVLERVGLAEKADQPIDTPAPLSGGQLKRVSLAVELVSNPAVIFLDEVTSGLDAGTDKRMMGLFAQLATEKKTLVCVTHTLENIEVCHLVTLLHRGRLAYFGPPSEALGHFQIPRLSDVYDMLESAPAEHWAERFEASPQHQTYVVDRLAQGATTPPPPATTPIQVTHRAKGLVRQAAILTRRYVDLIVVDRRNLAILLLQAPLIGLVIGLVFTTEGIPAVKGAAESQIGFVLVISAIWFGCLNSAREVVKELPIYLRERAINLSIVPYLVSKLVPLTLICALQTGALVLLVSALLDISGSDSARFGALFLAGLAATAMGLVVSSLVNSNDKAVATVPILLIPQVVLADAIVDLKGASEIVGKATMISFWAFAAIKRSLGPEIREALDPFGEPVLKIDAGYGESFAMLGVFFVVFLTASGIALKLKDRKG